MRPWLARPAVWLKWGSHITSKAEDPNRWVSLGLLWTSFIVLGTTGTVAAMRLLPHPAPQEFDRTTMITVRPKPPDQRIRLE